MSLLNENIKIGFQGLALFLASLLLFSCVYMTEIYFGFVADIWGTNLWSPILYLSIINIALRFYLSGFLYDVSVRATFLGCAFATGIYLSCFDDGWKVFGIYAAVMAFFHFSEFFTIAMTNPMSLSLDSFILNHSKQYIIAAVASWIEWSIEFYFWPGLKEWFSISFLGLLVCILGEMLRKGAMVTARANFNHCVQFEKHRDHVLVTHGLYSMCRHPSYVGWFYWSIGTQIILLNPFCAIGYAAASWLFFNERVFYEEYTLVNFFGDTYRRYQKSVCTGLPFVKGFV
ncbi:isoprenylcysteine carboxylmethyltransferase ste14 [Arctopsyche grandis]|uniref:isoprenylcysteine carboxylmethyltransferase ste14 n=1 Tax=Arctopsyche grandis TaxID=121162 RepID=UPI00406D928A